MSAHPRSCQGCAGSGYADGPPIVETIGGKPHRYTTVVQCAHDWWHDDTGWTPEHDEFLAADHPRAVAAFNRGYAQGIAERDAMRDGTAVAQYEPARQHALAEEF